MEYPSLLLFFLMSVSTYTAAFPYIGYSRDTYEQFPRTNDFDWNVLEAGQSYFVIKRALVPVVPNWWMGQIPPWRMGQTPPQSMGPIRPIRSMEKMPSWRMGSMEPSKAPLGLQPSYYMDSPTIWPSIENNLPPGGEGLPPRQTGQQGWDSPPVWPSMENNPPPPNVPGEAAEDDGERPISFVPVLPNGPVRPPPPVEHGTTQA